MDYRQYFKDRKLLTDGSSNTKTAKNSMKTYYLSLQPTDLNSKQMNLCRFSTKECRNQCLQYAGRQGFDNVVKSRTNKTEFLVNYPVEFITKLYGELEELNKKGNIAIRLNLLSDLNWDAEFEKNLGSEYSLADFPNIQFYDYTKDHFKLMANNIPNYDLTLSFSGHNWHWCKVALDLKKANVAVVFKNSLPSEYQGFEVVNGDESDERFLEKKGVIVGLKYKMPKGRKYESNKFVIEN
jgi:hypothetical protein